MNMCPWLTCGCVRVCGVSSTEHTDMDSLKAQIIPIFRQLDNSDGISDGSINASELAIVFIQLGWTIPAETTAALINDEKKAGRTILTLDQVVAVCGIKQLRNLRIAQRIQKGQQDQQRMQKLRVEAKSRAVLYHLSGTHVKVAPPGGALVDSLALGP